MQFSNAYLMGIDLFTFVSAFYDSHCCQLIYDATFTYSTMHPDLPNLASSILRINTIKRFRYIGKREPLLLPYIFVGLL